MAQTRVLEEPHVDSSILSAKARRLRLWMSAIVVILVVVAGVGALAALSLARVNAVAQELDAANGAAQEFMSGLAADPASAQENLNALSAHLSAAEDELQSIPLPQLSALPFMSTNMSAVARALEIAKPVAHNAGPSIVAMAGLFDPRTGNMRPLSELPGGVSGGLKDAKKVAETGVQAIDTVCKAALQAEQISTDGLHEKVGTSIVAFSEGLRTACTRLEDQRSGLERAQSAGSFVDSIGGLPREILDYLRG